MANAPKDELKKALESDKESEALVRALGFEAQQPSRVPKGMTELVTVDEDDKLNQQLLAADADMNAALDDNDFGTWDPAAGRTGAKILLYGPSGTGKSSMAGTFPDVCFVDLEGGMGSIAQPNIARLPKNPLDVIRSMSELRRAYQVIKASFDKPKPRFQTVCLDSLNELQTLIVEEILEKFPDSSRVYKTQLTRSDYGKLFYDFMKIFRAFMKLPCTVIFTVGEAPREFVDSKAVPLLVGQATAPAIERLVGMIGHVTTLTDPSGKVRHVVSFTHTEKQLGKDRILQAVTHNQIFDNTYQAVFVNKKGIK